MPTAKITKSAKRALESGIETTIINRSSGGQICQNGYILTKDKKTLVAYWDNSETEEKRLQEAKIFSGNWRAACIIAVNS